MINNIAAHFGYMRAEQAATAVADHIKRFWDPRMRRDLLRWTDEHGGEGLRDSVRDAIAVHREKLMGGL